MTDNFKICNMVKSERPRERLLSRGSKALSNAELLAIIISSGNEKSSAIELANRVLAMENGSLEGLSRYMPQELMSIPGIGTATACRIISAIELGKRVYADSPWKTKADNPERVFDLCADLRHSAKEHFRVLLLNTKLEVIKTEDVSIGGIASTAAQPREVFSDAVRIGAYAVVLVHNHPSGDPRPSDTDISITKKLCECGRLLGIEVVDHVIIGCSSYYSFKGNNFF